jgi:GNAT superfamily N-acetyltransferase
MLNQKNYTFEWHEFKGSLQEYDADCAEIKRMFVKPEYRGGGIATFVLTELEVWAKELNYTACILETGKKQPEAIALYQKVGYTIIPSYGQYKNIENSVCMKKEIR